ncbi:HD domain-containing protein [Thermogladius sp.]|jgi:uncharacterized protein|uniref:HD domain-containing protein n=1 Tax=Thermogladius sp. TaxID=2023064 RepID=UPI003D122A31
MEGVVAEARRVARESLGSDFDHGYPHVERVRKWAWEIVREEGLKVDPLVLDLSVYLHDVGRVIGEPHAYYSAVFAAGFLKRWGLDDAVVEKVVNAIEYHSFSYSRSKKVWPMSTEALVLSDADKLDALGVVGFLRVFAYNWKTGSSMDDIIKHFHEKIFRLKDLMHFAYSKRRAEELTSRVERVVRELLEELSSSSEGS